MKTRGIRITKRPSVTQPLPPIIEKIKTRRMSYLRAHGFSTRKIIAALSRGDLPEAIVVRRIGEDALSHARRVRDPRARPAKRRKRVGDDLALEILAHAKRATNFWIDGKYTEAVAEIVGMAAMEAFLQSMEMKVGPKIKGAKKSNASRIQRVERFIEAAMRIYRESSANGKSLSKKWIYLETKGQFTPGECIGPSAFYDHFALPGPNFPPQ